MVYTSIPGQPEQIALPSDRRPADFVFSFLSANGSTSLNTNGAGSAVTFSYIVPSSRSAHITRCNILLMCPNQRPSLFGGRASLETGIKLITIDTSVGTTPGVETFDFCDDETIKTNADFSLLAGVNVELDSAPADDARYVRWTIEKAGHPLLLKGGEGISMVVQDDLSVMDDFRVLIQGVLLPV